jgi:NAD(P)-dependent dehydrogenase (short-subunit alcohol dehydrogenase family)
VVLAPNEAAVRRAAAAGVQEIAVFASCTETFSQRNLGRSIDDAFRMHEPTWSSMRGGTAWLCAATSQWRAGSMGRRQGRRHPGRGLVTVIDSEEFKGRVALVTGAAGEGIGRATARRLALGGATVVVTDVHERRTREVTAALASETGASLRGIPLDVSDREQANRVMAQVADQIGPVTILVNNAAMNVPNALEGDVFDYDPELFDRLVAVNMTGCWYMAMLAGQHMKRAGGGAIVNIGSIAADRGSAAYEPAYAMSKAAMHSLTQVLAKAGGRYGIRANEVTMGVVDKTHFMNRLPHVLAEMLPQIPLGRHAVPEDIAEAVAFLASDRASFITGDILNVTGGFLFR